jgi:hypothetical protein
MSKSFLAAHLRSLTFYLMVYGCAEQLSHKLMQVYSLPCPERSSGELQTALHTSIAQYCMERERKPPKMQRTLPEDPPPLTLAIVEYNAFRHPVYIIPSVHALELYCTLFYEPTALHTYSISIIRTPNQSISGPVQRTLTPSGKTPLKSVDLAMTSPLQCGSLSTMSATYTPYPRVPHTCTGAKIHQMEEMRASP